MRNWSVDTTKMDVHSAKFITWKLEQLINFGLQGERIDTEQLRTYLPSLTLDPAKKNFLKFLLAHAYTN